MRVLYFSQGFSPHDQRFLEALASTGNEINFLRLEQSPSSVLPKGVKELAWEGSKTPITWKNIALIAREFAQVAKNVKPDLVHAGPIQGPALIAAYAGFHPLVTMSWGSDLLRNADSSWWMRTTTRYTLRHTDVMVGDCQTVAEKAVRYGFSRDRIRLFPWGVDLEHFHPDGDAELRTKLGWEQKFILLCNRSMEPLYGVDVAVKGFLLAAKQMPELHLMLFGKGSQEKMLHDLVDRAGMQDRVYFGGFSNLEELPAIYRSADLYLSASHSDGSSVSLMEALACGVPALVSDIPSNREWIQSGVQGWLFKDGDEKQLAKAIQAAAFSKDLPKIRSAARDLALTRADWKKNFQVLLQAYDLAIRSH